MWIIRMLDISVMSTEPFLTISTFNFSISYLFSNLLHFLLYNIHYSHDLVLTIPLDLHCAAHANFHLCLSFLDFAHAKLDLQLSFPVPFRQFNAICFNFMLFLKEYDVTMQSHHIWSHRTSIIWYVKQD